MVAANKRVLVMDDEDVVCKSYEKVLSRAGFEVQKAHSGSEALAEVKEHDFDVMLADLKMPGMGGLDVIRQVRETHPQMPIIVITGFPSQNTLEEAAQLGVTDYLTKPVAPDVLTQAANQALTAPAWLDQKQRFELAEAKATLPRPYPATTPVPPRLETAPAVAVPVPEAAPVPVAAPTVAPAVAEPVVEKQPGVLKTAAALAAVPVISLAYVIFLPLAGFAVVLGLGAKKLVGMLGAREA